MYKLNLIAITAILLMLCQVTLSLRCFYGSSKPNTVTQSQFANPGDVCIKYFQCNVPTVNGGCPSNNGTWYSLGFPANLYNSTFSTKYTTSLMACATDYCNLYPNARTLCYIGVSSNLQQSELTLNATMCYTGLQGNTRYYGMTSDCTSVTLQNTQCCSTNLCNGQGAVTSKTNAGESFYRFVPLIQGIVVLLTLFFQ